MGLTSRIQALTAYANEVTGQSDTNLSDAVATLAEGYGQGGETIYYGANGAMYTKDMEIPSSSLSTSYTDCKYLETVYAPNATSFNTNTFYNCKSLRSVRLPLASALGNYVIRQQGEFYNHLEEVIVGSIGHPITNIGSRNWRYGSHAMVLNTTIYVNYEKLEDIPSSMQENAIGNEVFIPTGAVVNVIFRSSVTGEVLS